LIKQCLMSTLARCLQYKRYWLHSAVIIAKWDLLVNR